MAVDHGGRMTSLKAALAAGFIQKQRFSVCVAGAGALKPDLFEHPTRGDVVGFHHGHDVLEP
jgi:hypothetical protein